MRCSLMVSNHLANWIVQGAGAATNTAADAPQALVEPFETSARRRRRLRDQARRLNGRSGTFEAEDTADGSGTKVAAVAVVPRPKKAVACRFGAKCKRPGCKFEHPPAEPGVK